MVKIKKNPDKPILSAIPSEYSAIIDANLPDKPVNTYQIPNKKPNIRAGANLLTYDKPTGDTASSPMVCNKYANNNQIILTEAVFAPGGIDDAPIANIPKPAANKVKPPKNFCGPENLYFSQNFE